MDLLPFGPIPRNIPVSTTSPTVDGNPINTAQSNSNFMHNFSFAAGFTQGSQWVYRIHLRPVGATNTTPVYTSAPQNANPPASGPLQRQLTAPQVDANTAYEIYTETRTYPGDSPITCDLDPPNLTIAPVQPQAQLENAPAEPPFTPIFTIVPDSVPGGGVYEYR